MGFILENAKLYFHNRTGEDYILLPVRMWPKNSKMRGMVVPDFGDYIVLGEKL